MFCIAGQERKCLRIFGRLRQLICRRRRRTAGHNDDGKYVDLEEFLAAGDLRAAQRFADIDTNDDQQLTSDEIDAQQAARKQQRDAHRACIAEQLDEDNLLN